MNNPNNNYGEGIQPPRTGDYELSQLLQYPNARVRALAEFLRNGLHWTTRDSFTGECISHLINYVEQNSDGSFNFSRIHSGSTAEQNIAWYRRRSRPIKNYLC